VKTYISSFDNGNPSLISRVLNLLKLKIPEFFHHVWLIVYASKLSVGFDLFCIIFLGYTVDTIPIIPVIPGFQADGQPCKPIKHNPALLIVANIIDPGVSQLATSQPVSTSSSWRPNLPSPKAGE
jgi:hypothetical protein